jgi:O-antigen/teichoic acid export membrane protein
MNNKSSNDVNTSFSKIAKNSILNIILLLVGLVISFFLTPFIVNKLGTSLYGLYGLIISLTGYLVVLDLGLGNTLTKYTSEYYTLKKYDELSETASTLLVIYAVIGLAGIFLTFLLSLFLPLFHVPIQYLSISKWAFVLSGITFAVSLPLSLYGGLIAGLQRYDIKAYIGIAVTVINAGITLFVLFIGGRLISLILINLFSQLLIGIVSIGAVKRLYGYNIKIKFNLFRKNRVKELFLFSASVFIIQIAGILSFNTDTIVIGYFLTLEAVALYTIAQKLIRLLTGLVFQLVDVLFPAFSALAAVGDNKKIILYYINAIEIALVLSAPVFIGFLVFGKNLLTLWVGNKFGTGYTVLIILSVAMFFHYPAHIGALLLIGMKRHKTLSFITIIDAISNLIISIVLVKPFGINGVAMGTAIALFVSNGIVIPLYIDTVLGIPHRKFILAYAKVLFVAVIPAIAAVLLKNIILQNHLYKIIIEIGGVAVLFFILYGSFALTSDNKKLLIYKLKEVTGKYVE